MIEKSFKSIIRFLIHVILFVLGILLLTWFLNFILFPDTVINKIEILGYVTSVEKINEGTNLETIKASIYTSDDDVYYFEANNSTPEEVKEYNILSTLHTGDYVQAIIGNTVKIRKFFSYEKEYEEAYIYSLGINKEPEIRFPDFYNKMENSK